MLKPSQKGPDSQLHELLLAHNLSTITPRLLARQESTLLSSRPNVAFSRILRPVTASPLRSPSDPSAQTPATRRGPGLGSTRTNDAGTQQPGIHSSVVD